MARRIRVKLSPLSSGLGDAGQTIADGATVSFVTFGSGGSVLNPDTPAPAKLTFEARFIERIRDPDCETETRTLATLEGNIRASKDVLATLRFEGTLADDGKPAGLIPDPDAAPDQPPAAGGEDSDDRESEDKSEIRIFRFAFDPGQFSQVAPTAEPTPLRVLVDPSRFRYCEISVTLEIDGQPEGDGAANDILDVPIRAHNPALAAQETRSSLAGATAT